MYTTGDVAGGIRLFLGLLRGSSHRGLIFSRSRADGDMSGGMRPLGMDKIFLEDFRVAFEVLILLYTYAIKLTISGTLAF